MRHRTTVRTVWHRVAVVGTVFLLFLVQLGCAAQDKDENIELLPYDFSYQSYAQLLSEYVRGDRVDYASLKQERSHLDTLVADLGRADLSGITRDQRLAFYSNAYNIITLRSIIDAYPVSSIKDIDGVWDKQAWTLAGEQLTLNQIEHEILRKEFQEPRIHVAVNCASIGCPPLLEVPYYPDRLDSLLTISSQRFAASGTHNQIDTENKTARLSAIFDWYGDDFIERYYESGKFSNLDKKKGAALNFIISHLPEETAEGAAVLDYTVEFLEYDWNLNDLSL